MGSDAMTNLTVYKSIIDKYAKSLNTEDYKALRKYMVQLIKDEDKRRGLK